MTAITPPMVSALGILTDNAAGDQSLAVRAAALDAALTERRPGGMDTEAVVGWRIATARMFEDYLTGPQGEAQHGPADAAFNLDREALTVTLRYAANLLAQGCGPSSGTSEEAVKGRAAWAADRDDVVTAIGRQLTALGAETGGR